MARDRLVYLDLWRGLAIIFMVIFHFAYDLDHFKFIEIDFQKDLFWYNFPRLIVFMFLIGVGAAQSLVHKNGIVYRKVFKRFLQLSAFALLISLYTYFFFPNQWIYFGILHNIAVSSMLILYFINRPYLSLSLSIIIFLVFFLLYGEYFPPSGLTGENGSMDFIPIYPWFSVVLLGCFLENKGVFSYYNKVHKSLKWMLFMGRHSLVIYLIHQPFLYGIVKMSASIYFNNK